MPIEVDPPSITEEIDAAGERIAARIAKALGSASIKLAENILVQGRQDIAGAGKFGPRWTQGFTYDVEGEGNVRTISFKQAVPYWKVFQYGAVIKGKPLLWIPMSYTGITVRARDFPGRLFRVNRKSGGAPLLLSVEDKQVKYHGQESVRIPKKFHLVEIIRAESKTIGALYRLELASGD